MGIFLWGLQAARAETPAMDIALAKSLNHLMVLALHQYKEVSDLPAPQVTWTKDGKQALSLLEKGDVQTAVVGLGPLATLENASFSPRILASLSSVNNLYHVLTLKGSRIQTPADLRGKTIAVSLNSTMHVALIDLLTGLRIEPDQVKLVTPSNNDALLEMLRSGEVDAVCTRDPYLTTIQETLKEKVQLLGGTGSMGNTFHLVTTQANVQKNAPFLKNLLQALLAAEAFLRNKPSEAIPLLATLMEKSQEQIKIELANSRSYVRLDSSLILKLEAMHRWHQRHSPAHDATYTSFHPLLAPDLLRSVRPDRVDSLL
ncbi:MAG: ABC transporter substrate-binding protein [Magnetococcales bacterium]|nr:ABC transporter substrate-binding protein [Magnetococcales bacterium]